jgi:hypothetical protein
MTQQENFFLLKLDPKAGAQGQQANPRVDTPGRIGSSKAH